MWRHAESWCGTLFFFVPLKMNIRKALKNV
jgi:hypothetical protein